MEQKYKLRDITPRQLRCFAGLGCPAIYLEEITPKDMRCMAGPCPAIYKDEGQHYFLIGEKVDPKNCGLEEKVSQNECLIRIKRDYIDKRET